MQGSEEGIDLEYHTDNLAKKDMGTLYSMWEGKFEMDKTGLFKLLCSLALLWSSWKRQILLNMWTKTMQHTALESGSTMPTLPLIP
jgi:hypothetical protein